MMNLQDTLKNWYLGNKPLMHSDRRSDVSNTVLHKVSIDRPFCYTTNKKDITFILSEPPSEKRAQEQIDFLSTNRFKRNKFLLSFASVVHPVLNDSICVDYFLTENAREREWDRITLQLELSEVNRKKGYDHFEPIQLQRKDLNKMKKDILTLQEELSSRMKQLQLMGNDRTFTSNNKREYCRFLFNDYKTIKTRAQKWLNLYNRENGLYQLLVPFPDAYGTIKSYSSNIHIKVKSPQIVVDGTIASVVGKPNDNAKYQVFASSEGNIRVSYVQNKK